MGDPQMLRTNTRSCSHPEGLVRAAAGLALALLLPTQAHAAASPKAAVEPSLRQPQRLTAGGSDQFLGCLSPDGGTLYYVSNRNATAQVFRQDLLTGAIDLVVDDEADVSFPRISPDGTSLLYISTRDDASGDACIRPAAGGKRRCLTDDKSAEVQAFWYPKGDEVGVVTRKGLDGALELRRLPAGGGSAGTQVHPGSVSSPAISPDGQWLVWVPIERSSDKVGVSFSMRLGRGLMLRKGGGQPIQIRFSLPGVTGFPAFSADGRWLYFARYLSDTNFDGRIDGDDHGVIFRVHFDTGRANPLDGSRPEQLTSARWNCQYPSPARDKLVMTCHFHGSLDVYSLPLDGAVPATWKPDKLREVLEASSDPWQQLMLLDRLQSRETDNGKRLELLRETTRLHLRLEELTSAAFFAEKVAGHPSADAATRGWAQVVLELIAHRNEERRLDRGQLNDRFIADQQARIARLEKLAEGAPESTVQHARLARAEIFDVIGDKAQALKLIDGLDLKQVKDRMVLLTWAERALPILRDLGERDRALAGVTALCHHFSLSVGERLDWSEQLIDLLLRGQPQTARAGLIAAWREKLEVDSEVAFRFDLEALLLKLDGTHDEAVHSEVRQAVFELYREHTFLLERRALVSATLRKAAETNSARMLYQFANSWASWVDKGHVERDRAVALYRQVVLERGYVREAEKNWLDAHGSFWGLTVVTDDLEAWIGVIDMADKAGRKNELADITKRYKRTPDHPVVHFVAAYDQARKLASLRDPERKKEVLDAAQAELDKAAPGLLSSPAIHHLRGYLAHQRFLGGYDRSAAFSAHSHYLMGLDLARGNPRYEAAILHAVGLLQAAVGNHWIALEYLNRRAELPFMTPQTRLSLLLARARSLFHIGREAEGASAARDAYKLANATPELKAWVPLCLDRAALYAYAAGELKRASTLYRLLEPMMGTSGAEVARSGNQLRAAVMQAAAELAAGQFAEALAALDRADRLARATDDDALMAGARPYQRTMTMRVEDYRVIMTGLRAQALRGLGRDKDAGQALAARRVALQARIESGGGDDTLLQLAAVERDLAAVAAKAQDKDEAARRLEAGLAHCATFQKRTGTVAPPVRLVLLRAYAELHLFGKVPLSALRRDLVGELAAVYAFLCERPNPRLAAERFVFKLYLATLRAGDQGQ